MRSRFLSAVLLLPLVLRAAEPIVWRLEQANKVGGHATEVLGTPQADADGRSLRFNGTSDGVFVPVNPLQEHFAFTIEALIKPDASGSLEQRFLHVEDTAGARTLLELRLADGTWALDGFVFSPVNRARLVLFDPAKRHPAGRWTWVALVYDMERLSTYVNGVKELEEKVAFPPLGAGRVSLGVRQNKIYWYKGSLGEVRWHGVALPPEALQRVAP